MDADGIEGVPIGDEISAKNAMNGREIGANVLRRVRKGGTLLLRMGKGAGQGLVELVLGFRDAFVDFGAGCLQGI